MGDVKEAFGNPSLEFRREPRLEIEICALSAYRLYLKS